MVLLLLKVSRPWFGPFKSSCVKMRLLPLQPPAAFVEKLEFNFTGISDRSITLGVNRVRCEYSHLNIFFLVETSFDKELNCNIF